MAEILTQRAVVLAEVEATFGVDPIPVPADDALLVDEPDFSVDITTIERNFARTSISPLPIAAGRKIASMTFNHEVRSNGSTSTPPRIGKVLRACGLAETTIAANGTIVNGRVDVTADAANTGDAVVWVGEGTEALIRDAGYTIRGIVTGPTTTAEVRVTGGVNPEDLNTDVALEESKIPTETYMVEVVTGSGVTGGVTIDDTTDPANPTYDFTSQSGWAQDDVLRVTVMGLPFLVTITNAVPDATNVGDDVEAAVDAHADMTATNTAGVVDVTFSGALAGSGPITSATTVIALGNSGISVVPVLTLDIDQNDYFAAVTKPVGTEYTPISDALESATLYMYFDGILHRLTGSRGTFTVEGVGGDLANFTFEMTGNFETVTDVALPSAVFETTIPVQVELAQLQVNPDIDVADNTPVTSPDSIDTWRNQLNGVVTTLCAAGFTYDMGNNITPRECINEADSFNGVVLVTRQATGSMDPELELVATHDFWGILSTADVMSWQVRVGTIRGNIVRLESESVQYAGLSYADRDGLRVLEVDLRFSASSPDFSDDEILIAFN